MLAMDERFVSEDRLLFLFGWLAAIVPYTWFPRLGQTVSLLIIPQTVLAFDRGRPTRSLPQIKPEGNQRLLR